MNRSIEELLVDANSFKTFHQEKEIELFSLTNENGMTVQFSNLGARIVSVIVQDKNNNWQDVSLGMRTAKEYLTKDEPYYGAVIGPFTGRISNAQFKLGEETHHLTKNNGVHTLHGGEEGMHFVVWDTCIKENKITFSYTYPDKKEGFPGPINFKITYTLTNNNELIVDYLGQSEQPTIINLTNHAYFNLNGEGSGSIENHYLQINSNKITALSAEYTQEGIVLEVENSPFDFQNSKQISSSINENHQQLINGNGFDHYYILKEVFNQNLNHAATAIGDISGIVLDVYTTAQGVHLYTGNFMSDKIKLKNGSTDSFQTAFCLETQDFPDSLNQENYPSKIYQPTIDFQSQTIYKFSIQS